VTQPHDRSIMSALDPKPDQYSNVPIVQENITTKTVTKTGGRMQSIERLTQVSLRLEYPK